ncbi:MAG TPA: hypothetical protein VK327_02025 [Candidatus Paceibacterota bacterium]|nr:hypothetical protein [Candidatus Paceibacterota bacterium]
MRNIIIRVFSIGTAIAQLAGIGLQAATIPYQLDNGMVKYPINAADGTETHDTWFANEFTAQANANSIVSVMYFLSSASPSYPADIVIYKQTSAQTAPLGFTRIYTQPFTPLAGMPVGNTVQSLSLTTPVQLEVGDKFLVAIFMRDVVALPPNDKYPWTLDTSGDATGTFWDRSAPDSFNLDDLSGARPINQNLADGNWNPGAGHVMIRAFGTAVPEPSVLTLCGLAAAGAVFATRRRCSNRE